jgi:hypothetical protein
LDRFKLKAEVAMHPVNYLFEDIYRNHWGIPEGRSHERMRWYGSRRRRSTRDAAAI